MIDRKVITPSAQYESSYCAYIEELGTEERYPFVMDFAHQPFTQLLTRLEDLAEGIDVPEGAVANQTYWLVEDDELLAVANLRPQLSPEIANIGGHIGIGVRPSARGRGCSKMLLTALLGIAAEQGLQKVSVHCYNDNAASKAMIEACGGQLDSLVNAGKQVVARYIISCASV
ncbi:GNAT family N-acetyltransferase [Alteromonas sp. ASW11-36]|uniref:GNAT family N-acetyltransferase n=1 Tax=Alteromonas arenosi TaxID=3055817 RepID=A0ABT7SS54_9ALTE|nr:GNAT family N-acetyltransferase [Alteromonas sp. ASW11-36]MDM7859017.1 GNAT family N-acetyltransferase [Alteromonas sp. ASW11-36]